MVLVFLLVTTSASFLPPDTLFQCLWKLPENLYIFNVYILYINEHSGILVIKCIFFVCNREQWSEVTRPWTATSTGSHWQTGTHTHEYSLRANTRVRDSHAPVGSWGSRGLPWRGLTHYCWLVSSSSACAPQYIFPHYLFIPDIKHFFIITSLCPTLTFFIVILHGHEVWCRIILRHRKDKTFYNCRTMAVLIPPPFFFYYKPLQSTFLCCV